MPPADGRCPAGCCSSANGYRRDTIHDARLTDNAPRGTIDGIREEARARTGGDTRGANRGGIEHAVAG